ncbi:MAG: sigma-70 family RNA polymerase sigma factor [Vicinamibacterales bacterium]
MLIPHALTTRLHTESGAARWQVSQDTWRAALSASASKAFEGRDASSADLERYLRGLHLEDLALAVGCAAGDDEAWQHFVLTFRPVLYRAAGAIGTGGDARDLADGLHAELFGLGGADGVRRSLFRYFHGRSSLSTWLRSVLAQRHIDGVRVRRRTEPLPETADGDDALADTRPAPDPDRHRFLTLMRVALAAALGRLESRDRLRLACYYSQQMTLAQIGRLLGEHEATVSRHLSRTRGLIRSWVEGQLRSEHQLDDARITECFRSVAADTGPMDLQELLGTGDGKNLPVDRSSGGGRA